MPTTPLKALRVFEAVARTGSFRAAAEDLNVTQSAVSHQIRHLEAFLGTELFERQGNRTRLLPHGNELARSVSVSLAEIDTACQRASAIQDRQPLVIAAIPSIAMCWLIPRMNRFRAVYPNVETRMIYAMHGSEIDFRETHVAFVFSAGAPNLAGVEALPFLPGSSVPVCSPGLLDQLGNLDPKPDEMSQMGLLHDSDDTGWRSWLGSAGVPDTGPLAGPVFEDFNLLRAAAVAGQGVALCASAMIRSDLEAGLLTQLSQISVLDDHGYYLLIGQRARTEKAEDAAAFCDWAQACR